MTAKPSDPTIKALVETSPQAWPKFLGKPSGVTEVIDSDIATVSGAADKVLRVHTDPPYLLHLEFVSGHDAALLPRSLHMRNVLLDYRHGLLGHTAVILLRPEADSPTLTGQHVQTFPGQPPYSTFGYQVVRIWRLALKDLLSGDVGLLPLAPISEVTEAEVPGIIKQMEERLDRPKARRKAPELWAATRILMGLRYSREFAEQLLRGVRSMKESVTYQAILEEGEALGITKGEAKGALGEAKKILRLQGEKRFGPADATTVAALEGINDLGKLEHFLVSLDNVDSWQALLKQVPSRPRKRRQN
jgi:predicted transposase YdaD